MPRSPTSAGTSWRWPDRRCSSRASSSTGWARTCTWPAIRSIGTSAAKGKGNISRTRSIHDTYSRCVTVHGTDNVRVENNVTFNTVGHCFFLEDAVETGNAFVHNLGILTKCHPDGSPCVPTEPCRWRISPPAGQSAKDILIPSDNTASTFWITNPGQHLPRQCGRRVRGRSGSGSPCRSIRPAHSSTSQIQQEHLAAADAAARVQGQHRPLQLRRPDVRSRPWPRTVRSTSAAPGISPMPTRPIRRADPRWCRRSTIIPATRTATAPSGAAARYHLYQQS